MEPTPTGRLHPGNRLLVRPLSGQRLGEEVDLANDLIAPRLMMSRNLWIDPLLSPDDPFYPDITELEPGDADYFERIELKGKYLVLKKNAERTMQDWYDAWYAQRSPYCQRLTLQEQQELWHAHLGELIRAVQDPKMEAVLWAVLRISEQSNT